MSARKSTVSYRIALSDRYDILALASIFIDFISTLVPALIAKLPQIPVLYSIVWYLCGPGFSIELPVHGLSVKLGLPSLAFLIVPVIFVKMAARRSWQGTYQIFVPHLVCFFWWRLSIAFLARSTWFGLALVFVGWISLLFLLPLAPILLIGSTLLDLHFLYRDFLLFGAEGRHNRCVGGRCKRLRVLVAFWISNRNVV